MILWSKVELVVPETAKNEELTSSHPLSARLCRGEGEKTNTKTCGTSQQDQLHDENADGADKLLE